jgi:hypothetical protein
MLDAEDGRKNRCAKDPSYRCLTPASGLALPEDGRRSPATATACGSTGCGCATAPCWSGEVSGIGPIAVPVMPSLRLA